MAYNLEFMSSAKVAFRNIPGLSREGRIALWAGSLFDLRHNADVYRADPTRRLAPGSPHFLYEYIFRDPEGDRPFRCVRFVVNDATAAYGVLRVVYVEDRGI